MVYGVCGVLWAGALLLLHVGQGDDETTRDDEFSHAAKRESRVAMSLSVYVVAHQIVEFRRVWLIPPRLAYSKIQTSKLTNT